MNGTTYLTTSETFSGNNVYSFSGDDVTSTAGITLNFDGSGVYILKDIKDLTINGPITFNLTNGALASNIHWIVGITATINPTVAITWDGDILAGTSFTMSAGTSGPLSGTINGCVCAESGTATLAAETFINGCSATGAVPEPGSAGLAALGCLLGALCVRRYRSAARPGESETRRDISDQSPATVRFGITVVAYLR